MSIHQTVKSETNTDDDLTFCCSYVQNYNLSPFVSWGTTPVSNRAKWRQRNCNKVVGNRGAPLCSNENKPESLGEKNGSTITYVKGLYCSDRSSFSTCVCDPRYCANGGTCNPSPVGAVCICPSSHIGARCETRNRNFGRGGRGRRLT
eukprot:Pgem_evm2s2293